ncbi:MAG TPA: AAA family ATPase, partial [Steroidobacteraceae bacterium]|nr:AAA family ATPase [Steroidobacteraceae bacterium]
MAKPRTVFVCSACGADAPRWAGQCSACGEWNTLTSFTESRAARALASVGPVAAAQTIAGLAGTEEARLATGFAELDRVIGGGLVPGSVILIGGDPGIGKSTLLLQVLGALDGRLSTLYVTGEESLAQVGLRASRLGLGSLALPVLAETSVEQVLQLLQGQRPGLVVIDSIQTLYTEALDSAPGSVSQLRECAAQLVRFAKTHGTTVVLVGHVTKEGA